MEKIQRISQRLPDFYRVWDSNSILYKFIDAVAKNLEEAQQDLFRIMRTHWVDTAYRNDLEKLGALFNTSRRKGENDLDYRQRLKRILSEYKGGGTKSSILALVQNFLNSTDNQDIDLIEFPPTEISYEREVTNEDTWQLRSGSITDATPEITLSLPEPGEKIIDPQITNSENKSRIQYKGELKHGETLILKNKKATLNGADKKEDISGTGLKLSRKESNLKFEESLTRQVATFDEAVFGKSVFAIPPPKVKLLFRWTARKPATFKLIVKETSMKKAKMTKEEIEEIIKTIKAAGVRATVTIAS